MDSRRFRRRPFWCLCAGALGLFLAVACRAQQPPPATPSPQEGYRPTATIKAIMDSLVDPSADVLCESVATVITRAGTEERQPRTDEGDQRAAPRFGSSRRPIFRCQAATSPNLERNLKTRHRTGAGRSDCHQQGIAQRLSDSRTRPNAALPALQATCTDGQGSSARVKARSGLHNCHLLLVSERALPYR